MADISRRHFLKWGARLAAAMGLAPALATDVAAALADLAASRAPVIWLQGQSCSGCSVSFLNSDHPDPSQVLTGYISLRFHSTLGAATGHVGVDSIKKSMEAGTFFLVVEGAMPMGMPQACMMAHEPVTDQVLRAARRAEAVIALGACAAHGGIPGAENNPTGAVSVPDFLKKQGVDVPMIRLPGCPAHPDWLVGTLVHLIRFGLPELDDQNRPRMFYGRLVHDQCPRFADYERERFASTFSEDGCLFRLGCLGPITRADCNTRLWNQGTNTCINAGAPCVGCAGPDFARTAAFPFYRKGGEAGD